MIVEDVANLIASLRLDEPRPLAIWCIDRPAMYYAFLKRRDPQGEYMVTWANRELIFYGIPIRQFSPQNATEEELENRPYFCRSPGVWVEMKGGNHLRLANVYP